MDILGVQPAFDGVAFQPDICLREAERLALGDGDLKRHEIETGNSFGHGMLDLNAGVHFQEIKFLTFGVDEELHGADRPVANVRCEPHRSLMKARPQFVGQARRRRFLNDFLITALHGAIAFASVQNVCPIGNDLDFDMAFD